MDKMKQKLIEMIASGKVYGTILRQNNNMQLYWSPTRWNSPCHGQIAQPEKWVWLGVDGWWENAEGKELFYKLLKLVKSFPAYPAEYDYYGEQNGNA